MYIYIHICICVRGVYRTKRSSMCVRGVYGTKRSSKTLRLTSKADSLRLTSKTDPQPQLPPTRWRIAFAPIVEYRLSA